MRKLLLLTILLILNNTVYAAESEQLNEAEVLYFQYCDSCHGETGGMNMSKRIAPPLFAVKRHYIGSYPDEMTFVNAIADWVETRDVETALMPGAVRRFNVMPPIIVEREKVEKIAKYIYAGKINTPAQFEEHYRKQHGLKN